ncbi:MAG: hypothetical protein O7G87_17285 [bacterium]|nr:hypothetical protein [bacterium]
MLSHQYQIVGTGEREESLFFMLDSLLRSRIETGEETTDDEDVNVYLAGLLHSFMDQSFEVQNGALITRYESEVFAQTEACSDLRSQYRIYRSNGDYALMATGMFELLRSGRLETDEAELVARGRAYYRYASNFHERFSRKETGVSVVLGKLSDRFEVYTKVLSHMRVSYFNLLKRLSQGEIFHIQRKAQEGLQFESVREGRDCFLDAYSDWMKSGSELHRARVNAMGEALIKVDPKFRFEGI